MANPMKRRWNAWLSAGFLVTLVAFSSAYSFLISVPSRAVPWMDALLFGLGLVMIGIGLRRAYREPERYRGRVRGLILATWALLLFGLFLWFWTGVENVFFENGNVSLCGILVEPHQAGPYPAIVIIHGSDPMSYNHVAAKIHAAAFLRRGFAVLLYDKRGGGCSTGNLEKSDLSDLAGDVAAGVRYLRGRHDIKADQIGLFGRSQGGWVGPLAATLVDNIAFVISSSGTPMSPAEQALDAIERDLRRHGFSQADVEEATGLRKRLWDYYRRAAASVDGLPQERQVLSAALTQARTKPWFSAQEDLPVQLPPFDRERYAKLTSLFSFDPIPVLKQLKIPMLFVFGDEDTRISSERSFAILEALRRDQGTQVDTKVYPRVGHSLMTWRQVPPGYAAGYLDLIGDWAQRYR